MEAEQIALEEEQEEKDIEEAAAELKAVLQQEEANKLFRNRLSKKTLKEIAFPLGAEDDEQEEESLSPETDSLWESERDGVFTPMEEFQENEVL